jgi:hypothetical protein
MPKYNPDSQQQKRESSDADLPPSYENDMRLPPDPYPLVHAICLVTPYGILLQLSEK